MLSACRPPPRWFPSLWGLDRSPEREESSVLPSEALAGRFRRGNSDCLLFPNRTQSADGGGDRVRGLADQGGCGAEGDCGVPGPSRVPLGRRHPAWHTGPCFPHRPASEATRGWPAVPHLQPSQHRSEGAVRVHLVGHPPRRDSLCTNITGITAPLSDSCRQVALRAMGEASLRKRS